MQALQRHRLFRKVYVHGLLLPRLGLALAALAV
jgi:hypothetical protein